MAKPDNAQIQPPQASFDVQQDYERRKKELERSFKEFHRLVGKKVLDTNKSPEVKKAELAVVNDLVKAAQSLDNVNVGEGILALASIAIREQLIVRDRVNQLEYELCKALKDISDLKAANVKPK